MCHGGGIIKSFEPRAQTRRPREMQDKVERIKRNERIAAMTQVLTASPNKVFTLAYFCQMFSAAKSTR